MRLQKGTIRPGLVLAVLENGIIKASAPGLFSFEDDPEKLPPVVPWQIGSNCNSFTQPKQYDEVWIMNFTDNPRQLYWFRKDDSNDYDNIEFKDPDTGEMFANVEIICNRDINGDWATIHFTDGSGWIIGKGESIININKDGEIILTNGMNHRTITINGNGIALGSAENHDERYPAAKGDATETALYELCKLLNSVATKALMNPYTAAVGTALMTGLPNVTSKIPSISSSHVTID